MHKHIPLRMCIACRRHRPKPELQRFGVDRTTDRIVRLDGKFHDGRSVYICPTEECMRRAEKKRMAERRLKAEACDGLYELPEEWI